MGRIIVICFAALFLSACMTPLEMWGSTCEGYGFKRDTTEFAECIQREKINYEQMVF